MFFKGIKQITQYMAPLRKSFHQCPRNKIKTLEKRHSRRRFPSLSFLRGLLPRPVPTFLSRGEVIVDVFVVILEYK